MNNKPASLPIGIFDSGIGGLTVVQHLLATNPNESVLYFGDTARCPYGEKSPDTLVQYSLENASMLTQRGIKILVVACGSASAHAITALQKQCPHPIVDAIAPTVEAVATTTNSQRIVVLATTATIQSQAYHNAITQRLPNATVIGLACPQFVPLLEDRCTDPATVKAIVKETLKPLQHQQFDTVVLGCTHYPLLTHLIKEEIGPAVIVIDSAATCANAIITALNSHNLAAPKDNTPHHQYFSSDNPKKFAALSRHFFDIDSTYVFQWPIPNTRGCYASP